MQREKGIERRLDKGKGEGMYYEGNGREETGKKGLAEEKDVR